MSFFQKIYVTTKHKSDHQFESVDVRIVGIEQFHSVGAVDDGFGIGTLVGTPGVRSVIFGWLSCKVHHKYRFTFVAPKNKERRNGTCLAIAGRILGPVHRLNFLLRNPGIIPFLPPKRYDSASGQRSSVQGSDHTWTLKQNHSFSPSPKFPFALRGH